MSRLWQYLAFTNLLIGILAVAYSISYSILWHGYANVDFQYLILLLFGTVGLYSLHAVFSYKWIDTNSQSSRIIWIRAHSKLLLSITIVSITVCLYQLVFQISEEKMAAIILGLPAGILYVVPYSMKGERVRDLPYIKIFLVAIFWSYYCVYIPLFQTLSMLNGTAWIMLVASISFIFSLTIPFDYRDRYIDTQRAVNTFGNSISPKKTQWLSIGLQLCCILFFSILLHKQFIFSISYILTNCCALIVLSKLIKAQEDLYFSVLVESVLALPLIFCLIQMSIIN